MPGKQNKCCCRGADCLICSDTFDGPALSSLWVEKAGTWEIVLGQLISTFDGELLTSCRQGLPVGTTYNYQIRVTLVEGSGPWGIICKYTSPGNYDWIEVALSGGNFLPTFWRRSGGVDSLIMDITTHPAGTSLSSGTTSPTVTICYSEVGWTISGGPSEWTTCDCTAPTALPADTTVGFVGFNKGDFDDWSYYYHKLSNSMCQPCDCYCSASSTDYKCVPETLTLTLTPVVNDPDCTTTPTTLTFTLRQSQPIENDPPPPTYTKHPEKYNWYSDPVGTYEPVHAPKEFWFRLRCLGDGQFELLMLEYGINPPARFPLELMTFAELDGPSGGAMNTAIECTPIVITFPRLLKILLQVGSPGPFACDPFQALEYSAIVTE